MEKKKKKTPAKRMIYRFRLKGRTGMTGAIAGTRSNKFQKGFFFPNVNARYRTIIEYVISQQRLPSDDSASSETVFRFVDVSFHTVPKLDVLETSCTDGKAIACCIYLSLTKIEKEKRTNLKREKKKQNKKTCIVERDADACRAIITSESLEVLQFFSFFIWEIWRKTTTTRSHSIKNDSVRCICTSRDISSQCWNKEKLSLTSSSRFFKITRDLCLV